MDFKETKLMLDELIAEQENLRQKQLKQLVRQQGPSKAMQIVLKIAKMFNPNFNEEMESQALAFEKLQKQKEDKPKEVKYGKVIWKN